jgi:hypothetical protein
MGPNPGVDGKGIHLPGPKPPQRQHKELGKNFIHHPMIQVPSVIPFQKQRRTKPTNFSLKYPATSSATGHSLDKGGNLYPDPKSCVF